MSDLTKKDFEKVAVAIRDCAAATRPMEIWARERHRQSIVSMSRDIASVLALTNPKFDRTRFLALCDPGP